MEYQKLEEENQRLYGQVEDLRRKLTSIGAREEQWRKLCLLECQRSSTLYRMLDRYLQRDEL